MRVSQRLDYTVRMLVALARQPDGATAAAGDLAAALGLPRRFGEQQMTALAKTDLVSSKRGTGGGVSLVRPASEITALDVVRAVQGEVLDVPHTTSSVTSELWLQTARTLETALAGITLADLARRQAEIDEADAPVYFI